MPYLISEKGQNTWKHYELDAVTTVSCTENELCIQVGIAASGDTETERIIILAYQYGNARHYVLIAKKPVRINGLSFGGNKALSDRDEVKFSAKSMYFSSQGIPKLTTFGLAEEKSVPRKICGQTHLNQSFVVIEAIHPIAELTTYLQLDHGVWQTRNVRPNLTT